MKLYINKNRIFTLLNMKVDNLETLPRVVGDELDAYMHVDNHFPFVTL